MTRKEEFKRKLARVFDSDLHTTQWDNLVDYLIIALIIISTIAVFISTFDVPPACQKILHIIDIVTVVTFTIEVSLRIWAADEMSCRYKGFWGRIRYCLTFYGLVDIISTYSFYVALFFPLPYSVLKSLRVLRLLRVFRYMKSFKLLQQAIVSKAREMFISLQFLVVVTLMLSFVLFFYEHAAQPEIYNNGFKSVIWAFTQYIGDPGGFANTPPITFAGRLIASIIGLLGIALVAVPAGLIGAGFSEAMAKDLKKEKVNKDIGKLKLAFERKLDRPTGFQVVPQHLSICDIQARMGMKTDDILDAIESSDCFRLINLAVTQPIDEHPQDKLAIEHFYVNRPYGCCIDRGSKITVVSPSSLVDPCIGNFSYYLALIGGFNYISRELGELRPYKSYYSFADRYNHEENLPLYMEDLEKLTSKEGAWTITPLVASGANEPTFPTQFHFTYGAKKGDETYDDPNITLNDISTFDALYKEFQKLLETKYDLQSDCHRYHTNAAKNYFARHLNTKVNAIAVRIAWSVTCWDMRAIQIAQDFAQLINQHINHCDNPDIPALKTKDIGYKGY